MRLDGRRRLDFRQVGLDMDPLPSASGSCRLILGRGVSSGTDLLASVRIDLGEPVRDSITDELVSRVECNVEW